MPATPASRTAGPNAARSAPADDALARYSSVAIALHWLIGLAILAQMAFGFLLDDIAPRGTPARAQVINLHKSFGIVLGVLIAARIAWRLLHRPPPWPASFPAPNARLATLGHRALYACMFATPLAGYVASNFSRHGVRFFGATLPPWGPDAPEVYRWLNGTHDVLAVTLAVLVAGHVAVTVGHAMRDRGMLFRRMWPRRAALPPAG